MSTPEEPKKEEAENLEATPSSQTEPEAPVSKESPSVPKEAPSVPKEEPSVPKEAPSVPKESPSVPKESPSVTKVAESASPSPPAHDTSPTEEQTKEVEEEKKIIKELNESEKDSEKPEKVNEELQDASKLQITPTPLAVFSSPDATQKKNKQEEDRQRWKTNLYKFATLQGATKISDEDYLVNRENYKINREEFASGNRSKLFKCRKDGSEQIVKVVPLKNINLRYKNNLIKYSINVMRFLIENNHPSLVQHYAFFQSPAKLYVFMEILSGIDLQTYAKKYRKPNSAPYLSKIKKYGKDVAEGMNHLSVLGIAHCNIKTMNVCLSSDQASAKIVGFNNSCPVFDAIRDEEILRPKYTEWSFNYAPETMTGDFKAIPADVWSFGVLLVALLTGKPPFPKKSTRPEVRLKAHLHRHFVQPEQTLLDLLMKCFEKEPSKRIDIGDILLHPFFSVV